MVGVPVARVLLDRGDQDVAGLDVAVDEAELVRGVEGVPDLHEDPQQCAPGGRPPSWLSSTFRSLPAT